MRFEGRAVLVTGGATGIGRAAAIAFAREGAFVTIGDLSAEAEATVEAIRGAGGEAQFVRTDVASKAEVGALVAAASAPLSGDTILIEGRELKVIGPVEGDHSHATALFAPSIRALFPGDLVYNRMFMWTGEHGPAEVAAWRKALDRLAALQPQFVVPGHDKPGLPYDATALEWSRGYLADWEKAVAASKDSADLRRRITALYPDTIDALGDFILGTSSRVAKGEEPRWTE